jgi:adenine phosphoribosyltransferase
MKQYIKSYIDFPKDGIDFKCTASLCASPQGFALANNFVYSNLLKYCPVDKIIGIDARGFIFASVFAHRTRGPLVLARKPGKLPGDTISRKYDLEYGTNELIMQRDSFEKNDTVLIIDDLMATGGTIKAVIDMCDELEVKVKAVACIMDLPKLGGSDYVKNLNIPFYAGVVY